MTNREIYVNDPCAHDLLNNGVAEVKDIDLILLGWHKTLVGNALLGGTVILDTAPLLPVRVQWLAPSLRKRSKSCGRVGSRVKNKFALCLRRRWCCC